MTDHVTDRALAQEESMIAIPAASIVHVRVLSSAGCPHTPATIARIEEVARDRLIPIRLERVLVKTQEQADAYRFMGSPTVQVNGVDLDPGMRDKTTFGLT